MKNSLYEEMYKQYQIGYSLSEVGKMFEMTRQSVYSWFLCRWYLMRGKKKLPFLMFDWKKFTMRNTGYYALTDLHRWLMHIYKWNFYNWEIPPWHDIHHIDLDKTNNEMNNLILLTKSEHSRLHSNIRKWKK